MQGRKPLAGHGADRDRLAVRRRRSIQIGLGEDNQVARAYKIGGDALGIAGGADPQTEVRLLGSRPGPANALGLDRVIAVAQAGGVGQGHRITADDQVSVEHIPGRAGDGGDNGRLARDQGIEQGGLAGVGLADQDDAIALAHSLATPGDGERPLQVGDQSIQQRPGGAGEIVGHLFVGEVDLGLDQRKRLQQVAAEAGVGLRQPAIQLTESLRRLRRGLRVDQVGDGLGLGQVHTAVLEGAAGEFAGVGDAQTKSHQGFADRLHYRPSAVQVQFGAVLAGVGTRAWETEDEGFVEAAALVGQSAQTGVAGFQIRRAEGG